MPTIETPLLIIGDGPFPLVAAKLASGKGLPSLLLGHHYIDDSEPTTLDERSIEVLTPHGVLDVLRPYAHASHPLSIAPVALERGLKHHCVADMLITVYDRMVLLDRATDGSITTGRIEDGRSSWAVRAETVLDVDATSAELNDTIHRAATSIEAIVEHGHRVRAAVGSADGLHRRGGGPAQGG